MKRMEIRASVECLCRVPGAHHVPPTCKQTECMRTAHVGAVRIYEFHGLSSRRASNQEVVIVYSSWPRQILFSRQITFSFFSTRLTLFVSTLPYHFSLCRLFIISPPPRLHPPFPLSTTRRFLRQVLCTYINSSSVSLRDPLPPSLPSRHSFRGNRLVTRLRRAKQSSKHEETFVLVETRHISTAQPATTFTFTAFRT